MKFRRQKLLDNKKKICLIQRKMIECLTLINFLIALPPTEPDYVAKERLMYEKVEQEFLQHQNKRGIPPVNHHITNDNQSDGHVVTGSRSESVIQKHVTEDDQSDDSGLSGDADSLCSCNGKELMFF